MPNIFKIGLLLGCLVIAGLSMHSQNHYSNGNEAYITESEIGFNDVTINNGNFVYQYSENHKQYRYLQYVLIPDLSETPNGNYIDTLELRGYGTNITPNDNNFAWDEQSVLSEYSEFDRTKMFVSPLSDEIMNYAKALDQEFTNCNYGDCNATISGNIETLAYPEYLPDTGTYQLWTGEELISAGEIKPQGSLNQRYSQQQLDTAQHTSYCVSKYGKGWRLPTDLEVGHFNDEEGTGNGFDIAYQGNNNCYLWTSSLFKTYPVKRWPVNNLTGEWENCAGFVYVNNYVRCVFEGAANEHTGNYQNDSNIIIIYPNPSDNYIKISGIKNKSSYKIYNILGKCIKQGTCLNGKIIVNDIKQGTYLLSIFDNNNSLIHQDKISIY